VARIRTFFILKTSSFLYGHYTEIYSKWDVTIALYMVQNDISDRYTQFLFIIPITKYVLLIVSII